MEALQRTAKCQHYWRIDVPDGRLSNGECILCGERKRFPNYLSDCLIENDREKFEEWLAKQSRKKLKGKGNWDTLSDLEEGA